MSVFRRIMLGGGIIDIDTLPDTQKLYYTATAKVTPKRGSFSSAVIANKWDSTTGEGMIVCSRDITIIDNDAFNGASVLTSITIPDSVTSIGNSAFSGCTSLTSITIPSSVTSIGNSAFSGCSGRLTINSKIVETDYTNISSPVWSWLQNSKFTELILGDNIEKIGFLSFYRCDSLTSITIPDSVTSIGNSAFSYCSSLTSAAIPDNVISIGVGIFSDCSSLTSVTIGNGVTSIESSAFEYCKSLKSVIIGNGVTSIESSAFLECSSLTSVTIPESVTRIGIMAFRNCISLTSVTIPNSVTWIREDAFYNCTSMQYYDFSTHESVPLLGNTNTFSNIPSTCKIIVPDALYDEWIAATNWSAFANYIIKKSDWDASQVTE